MTAALIGWDSEFHLHNGTILTQLAEVFSVTIPNAEVDQIEATHYQSPNRSREYISGLKDSGEMTVEMNYIAGSTTDALIVAARAAGNARAFKIVVPTATVGWKFEGQAIVTGYERNIPLDDKMTAVMTLKVTGEVTESAAA